MDKWKVVAFGDGFAVQTPDPSPEATDIYNTPGPIICRQDKAGIYGSELSEKEAHLIATAPELFEELDRLAGEVRGCWGMAERALREIIGNTNYHIVEERLEASRAAIAKARRKP